MKKILIVDDDLDMHFIYKDVFVDRVDDFSLISVFSVNEALEVLKNQEVDLIVLDIIMEPLSGSYLYLKIKQDKSVRLKNIPVIISSVLGSKGLKHFSESKSAVIVEKPFSYDFFLKKVDELLK